MTPLVVVGAGGHGREVLGIIEAVNAAEQSFTILGVLADDADESLLQGLGYRWLGKVDQLGQVDAQYVIGIGDPAARRRIDAQATTAGLEAATLVHPQASVGPDVRLSPGVVMAAGARATTNVDVGRHTHLNMNTTVAHDCRLGDFVTVNPGANVSGNVVLGTGVTIGTGAAVIQGMHIGGDTTVGAGAVVITDLPANAVAVGVPARVIRSTAE